MRVWIAVLALGVVGSAAWARGDEGPAAGAKLQTKVVESQDGETVLKGFVAYDPTFSSLRPAVIVIHDWWGQGEFARKTAEHMAELGYVGFAADMYGGALRVDTPKEAGELTGKCRAESCALGRKRARMAYDAVTALPFVDKERVAVLGFCFGGTMSLELAWSGAPLKGAISFHGHPTAPREGDTWTADVLILHGADDPFVPAEMLDAFETALRAKKREYEIVSYSGAVHAFSDPGTDAHGLDGATYDKRAATRAFARCEAFLAEVLER